MHPVRGKKVMIQSVLLCRKDFFRLVVIHPVCRLYERIAIRMHFFLSLILLFLLFSLLKIIRLHSGLRGVTFLLTFP